MWMRGRQVDQPVQKLANLRSSIDVVAQPHYFGSFKRVSAHVREPLPQLLRFMQETVQVSHNNQARRHCIAVGVHHRRITEQEAATDGVMVEASHGRTTGRAGRAKHFPARFRSVTLNKIAYAVRLLQIREEGESVNQPPCSVATNQATFSLVSDLVDSTRWRCAHAEQRRAPGRARRQRHAPRRRRLSESSLLLPRPPVPPAARRRGRPVAAGARHRAGAAAARRAGDVGGRA